MTKETKITDTKDIFVVYTNTDLTEGRGYQYPLYVCKMEATAIRLAKKQGVQGSNADVEKSTAYRIGNTWYYPGNLVNPTPEDEKEDKKLQNRRAAIEKAKAAGLSDEDIALLR